jgi:hypothetical protein
MDLDFECLNERSDFCTVDEEYFFECDEAISVGRAIAKKYQLTYVPYVARYNDLLSEGESEDDEDAQSGFFLTERERSRLP